MKLIAKHTIHGALSERVLDVQGKPVLDARGRETRRHIDAVVVMPGKEFDPEELGIGADEIKSLIARKAVAEKGRLGSEAEPEIVPVAPNTAPRGPASGSTGEPAPNTEAVGRNVKRA